MDNPRQKFVFPCKRPPVSIVKALSVRLLFAIHNLLTISRAVTLTGDDLFWNYTLVFLPFIVESVFVIVKRKGLEFRWISSSILLFLCMDIFPIWVLEVNRTADANVTVVGGVTLTIDNRSFLYAVEQTFLLLMIVGRWLLPRGTLTRDKLSTLLLVLIGKACDLSDFFTLFQERRVAEAPIFRYFVLTIWTISVFQFPLVLSETKTGSPVSIFMGTEIWSIVVSLVMQEVPYLICRSFAIGHYGLLNSSIIFFTCKNATLIVMYSYRVFSIVSHRPMSTGTADTSMPIAPQSVDMMSTGTTDTSMTIASHTVDIG